ncbi:phosphatase PAP2 family protein [Rhodobacterales bacterium HKCCE4037]|nr:phosphatase PAP2 family protein [Rhodobacterales bacterium HKCCE4037]
MNGSFLATLPDLVRRNVEVKVLVFLALVVGTIWGLAELVSEVVEGDTTTFDRAILLLLRNPADLSDPIGAPWVEEAGRDLTAFGGAIMITGITLLTSGFFLLRRQYASMLYLLAAVGGGIVLSSLAKGFFERARPELVPYDSLVYTSSFPSGHSMMAATAYLTLGVLIARILPQNRLKAYVMSIALLITILVGVSRVYLGVHWPTDVLAGWMGGAAWAMICLVVARYLAHRGFIETSMV